MWRRYLENCGIQFLLLWLSCRRLPDWLKLESTPGGHLVQSRAQTGRSGKVCQGHVQAIFADFQGLRLHCLLGNMHHLHNKKFLLSSSGLSYFKLCPLPVVLLQGGTEKSLCLLYTFLSAISKPTYR